MRYLQAIWEKSFIIITIFFVVMINISFLLNDNNFLYITLAVIPICLAAYFMLFESFHFILLIAFLVPLAVPMGLPGDSQLSFPSELMIGIFAIFFLSKNLHSISLTKKILTHPLTILIIADFCWMAVATIFSSIPLVSFKRLIVRFCFISVFYFGFSDIIQNSRSFLKIFLAYSLGAVIPVISGIIFSYRHDFIITAHTQMTKPFYIDHGLFGACMAFISPFIAIAFFQSKGMNKMLFFILLLIVLAGLFFSYSRASWMSLVIAGLVYLLIWFRIKIPVLLLMASSFIFLIFIFRNDIENFSKTDDAVSNKDIVSQVKSVGNVKTDVSNTERINRWKSALRMFNDRPFTGFGPGTYQFIYGKYQTHSDLTRISTFNGDKGSSHSEYLTYLSETGFPGFIIYLLLILVSFQIALKNIYRSSGITKALIVSAFLGLITFYVHGLFNNFIDSDKMAILVIGSFSALMFGDIYLSNKQTDK